LGRAASPLCAALARITVDLGGHSDTPSLPNHVIVETNAENIVELITMLDQPPAVVAGNSLGCRVTLDVPVVYRNDFASTSWSTVAA